MRKLQQKETLNITGGVDCGANYDFYNGLLCGGAVFLAFTPAAPLALAMGNGCLIMAAGHLGGCKSYSR
ncbi:hypothetical protein [Runella zeae]|uniref:hypothetical protein n=1 Tax=Runella zeae TaxID=94255 RepID=UPI002356C7DB|nr:hypothetical protein [Runella zeae]